MSNPATLCAAAVYNHLPQVFIAAAADFMPTAFFYFDSKVEPFSSAVKEIIGKSASITAVITPPSDGPLAALPAIPVTVRTKPISVGLPVDQAIVAVEIPQKMMSNPILMAGYFEIILPSIIGSARPTAVSLIVGQDVSKADHDEREAMEASGIDPKNMPDNRTIVAVMAIDREQDYVHDMYLYDILPNGELDVANLTKFTDLETGEVVPQADKIMTCIANALTDL